MLTNYRLRHKLPWWCQIALNHYLYWYILIIIYIINMFTVLTKQSQKASLCYSRLFIVQIRHFTTKLGPTDSCWQVCISFMHISVVMWSSVASSRIPHRMSITLHAASSSLLDKGRHRLSCTLRLQTFCCFKYSLQVLLNLLTTFNIDENVEPIYF